MGVHAVANHHHHTSVCRVLSVFFYQAEDGIRDLYVTGVQTCALPILCFPPRLRTRRLLAASIISTISNTIKPWRSSRRLHRSEERRVGKSVERGGLRIMNK